MLLQHSSLLSSLFLTCDCLFVGAYLSVLPVCYSLTYSFSHYYSACAIDGQHGGHLNFWLPAFVKLVSLFIACLLADGETNILLLSKSNGCKISSSGFKWPFLRLF